MRRGATGPSGALRRDPGPGSAVPRRHSRDRVRRSFAVSARPQILLVPSWSEVQWAIKPRLEEWAEVASYDPPGVGSEPPAEGSLPEAVVARGAAEIER